MCPKRGIVYIFGWFRIIAQLIDLSFFWGWQLLPLSLPPLPPHPPARLVCLNDSSDKGSSRLLHFFRTANNNIKRFLWISFIPRGPANIFKPHVFYFMCSLRIICWLLLFILKLRIPLVYRYGGQGLQTTLHTKFSSNLNQASLIVGMYNYKRWGQLNKIERCEILSFLLIYHSFILTMDITWVSLRWK